MIDLKMTKEDLVLFNAELEKYKTFSSYNLENLLGDMKYLIQCVEEAKEIMEHLNKYDFLGTYKAPVEWMAKFFPEEKKG